MKPIIHVATGGPLFILCFEGRYPKQNTVSRLNANSLASPIILPPKKNFGPATPLKPITAGVKFRFASAF